MAIVWVCRLGVDRYRQLGRSLEVPRFDCPSCRTPMVFWGWWQRYLRTGGWCHRVWVRRQRCPACRRSHVVLPQFVTNRRLDELAVIGSGIEEMVGTRRGARRVAERLGLPHTTVRDWRRRFRSRAALLAMGVAAVVVALSGTLPRLSPDPESAALQAMAAARAELAGRRGIVGNAFFVANAICGSQLLTTNTHPPWAVV